MIAKNLKVFQPARRSLLLSALCSLLSTGALIGTSNPAAADKKQGPAEVPVEELMKAGDLQDISTGAADAKVTIVEYASLTCPHCQNFATKIFPEFKTKYIDSGKVRFIYRAFALNNLDAAAQMLTRCTDTSKGFAMIEVLYEKQPDWAFSNGNPVPKLFDIAKQAGFTQESFDKCLTDQKLLEQITAMRTRASETFGVNATPTFFINGKRLTETPTVAAFDKVIEPMLSATK